MSNFVVNTIPMNTILFLIRGGIPMINSSHPHKGWRQLCKQFLSWQIVLNVCMGEGSYIAMLHETFWNDSTTELGAWRSLYCKSPQTCCELIMCHWTHCIKCYLCEKTNPTVTKERMGQRPPSLFIGCNATCILRNMTHVALYHSLITDESVWGLLMAWSLFGTRSSSTIMMT